MAMATSPDKLNSVVRRILGNFQTDSSFFKGRKDAVKISVEHLLSEMKIETTAPPTTVPKVIDVPKTVVNTEPSSDINVTDTMTDTVNAKDTLDVPDTVTDTVNVTGSLDVSDITLAPDNGTEVTITTIVIHYNGSLSNVTGASLLNGSDVMSGVTVTLTPKATAANATTPTTPYQPMEPIGVDVDDTNRTLVISIDVPTYGMNTVEGIDKNGETVFNLNEDELFAPEEELPWCDD